MDAASLMARAAELTQRAAELLASGQVSEAEAADREAHALRQRALRQARKAQASAGQGPLRSGRERTRDRRRGADRAGCDLVRPARERLRRGQILPIGDPPALLRATARRETRVGAGQLTAGRVRRTCARGLVLHTGPWPARPLDVAILASTGRARTGRVELLRAAQNLLRQLEWMREQDEAATARLERLLVSLVRTVPGALDGWAIRDHDRTRAAIARELDVLREDDQQWREAAAERGERQLEDPNGCGAPRRRISLADRVVDQHDRTHGRRGGGRGDGRPAGEPAAGGLSVRATEKWAHNQRCSTNNAMFAARVDGDRLLRGTDLALDFGLSPFAIQRGARVEQIGRANGYAVTIDLLRTNFGFGIDEVVPLDLRHRFQKNEAGMVARARLTRQAVEANIHGLPDAPNIIDGAVLTRQIGGRLAYFEADGVGAKAGPVFHINEFKGWPVIDGRAEDAGKLGATQTQMGIYRYLLADLIDALGGSVETISSMGLLVTPKNVGLTLVGSKVDLAAATRVAETTLRNLPDPVDFVGALPAGRGLRPRRRHRRARPGTARDARPHRGHARLALPGLLHDRLRTGEILPRSRARTE